MSKDWIFDADGITCGFRCAAVILRDGKVLLQCDGRNEYALPGGHVKAGETGAEAVKRELQEELEADVCITRMLWSEECFWQWGERRMHTLSFYYLAHPADENTLKDDGAFHPQRDNETIQVGWVPVTELENLTVYPEFLKERINDLEPGHFITRA